MKFYGNLDMGGQWQLLNTRVQNISGDPSSPGLGQIWFSTGIGGDSQGRLKIKLSSRTMTIDDQYVAGVSISSPITNSGTSLAPTIGIQAASGSQNGYLSSTQYNTIANATNSNTVSTLVMRDSNGDFAARNISTTMVTITATPVNSTDAVNKAYADSIAAGFDPKASVRAGTTGILPSCTYVNGSSGVGATLTGTSNAALAAQDGVTLGANERLLVKNQAAGEQDGIYTLTQVGDGSHPFILTRTTDFNTVTSGPGLISPGAFLFIEEGTTLSGTQWVLNAINIVIGTTALTFTQFGAGSTYTNGSGLTLSGNQFSVNVTGNSLEISSGNLRVKSSATSGQPLLSGGSSAEAAYGALNLAGGSSIVSGLLPVGNGGTGVSTGSANLFFATPNGSSGAPGLRAIVNADLPSTNSSGSGTYTKITLNAQGIATSATTLVSGDIPSLDASKITTGSLSTSRGGTGESVSSVKYIPVPYRLPVKAIAITNVTIASPGSTIDGYSVAANDRLLLTGQSTASQNGIWIFNTSGTSLTRPDDYAAASTTQAYADILVEVLNGNTYSGTVWRLSTTSAITIDTTSTAWAQVVVNLGSTGVTGQLGIANGGTGSNSASGARSNLGATGKYAQDFGDGAATNFTITHNLGTRDVTVEIWENAAHTQVGLDNIAAATTNTITFDISPAPSSNQFRIVVVG